MKLNTKTIQVRGVVNDGIGLCPAKLQIRFTSDEKGETLSIAAGGELQFTVAYAHVAKLVEETRKSIN